MPLCWDRAVEMPSIAEKLCDRWKPIFKAAVLVIAVVALAFAAADFASARVKRHQQRAPCVDRPYEFSWQGILTNPAPQPNGCAPPVYQYNRYVGQDPDPNIRFQLLRDPVTGYTSDLQ